MHSQSHREVCRCDDLDLIMRILDVCWWVWRKDEGEEEQSTIFPLDQLYTIFWVCLSSPSWNWQWDYVVDDNFTFLVFVAILLPILRRRVHTKVIFFSIFFRISDVPL